MPEGPDHGGDPGRETGDRAAFLAPARRRLAHDIPRNPSHPPPEPSGDAPPLVFRTVDADDLLGSFTRAARAAGTVVHHLEGEPGVDAEADDELGAVVSAVVAGHQVATAVVSAESRARAVGPVLDGLVAAGDLRGWAPATDRAAVAGAHLGITSATALVAATGSVALDVSATGSRGVSLLPRVHLVVAPADQVVATPGDVLRPLAARGAAPSNLVLVTGPSRTGDIEQLLTRGVHGPVAVHVVITGCPPARGGPT